MRRAAFGCLVILVAVPALFYAGLVTRRPVAYAASYWTVDDRTIGVMIKSGGGLTCSVPYVDETTTEVRLRSRCDEPWLSLGSTGELHLTVLSIELGSALAGRTVIDGLGNAAVVCSSEEACR